MQTTSTVQFRHGIRMVAIVCNRTELP